MCGCFLRPAVHHSRPRQPIMTAVPGTNDLQVEVSVATADARADATADLVCQIPNQT